MRGGSSSQKPKKIILTIGVIATSLLIVFVWFYFFKHYINVNTVENNEGDKELMKLMQDLKIGWQGMQDDKENALDAIKDVEAVSANLKDNFEKEINQQKEREGMAEVLKESLKVQENNLFENNVDDK